MSSSKHIYRPLLKFLFQNEEKVWKELESFITQDDSSHSSHQLSLSDQAFATLRDKLLSHPLETACVLHRLHDVERKSDPKKDESNKVYSKDTEKEVTTINSDQKVSQIMERPCSTEFVFKECLDHCLRRIESLNERLLQMKRELEILENRPKDMSPRRSRFNNASESIEVTKLKEMISTTSTEKQKTIVLLHQIFSLSSVAGEDILEDLLSRMLLICHEKHLISSDNIYFSCLSCSKESLVLLCGLESKNFSSKPTDQSMSLINLSFLSSNYVKALFYNCVRNSKHILEWLFEMLTHNPVQSMTVLQSEGEKNMWLHPFCPMIFLNAWSTSLDKLDSLLWVAKIWEKQPKTIDPLLMKMCDELKRDLNFVGWCMMRNTTVKILPLLQLIRDHSPLYTLHRSLPLHGLCPDEVRQLLEEHCIARDPSGQLFSSCSSIFSAFCIHYEFFQVIASGMQLDNSVVGRQVRGRLVSDKSNTGARNFVSSTEKTGIHDRQTLISLYHKNIVEKLQCVKGKIDEIQPLEYRVEILENIFSLLFVRHSDVSDESLSESGGEDGDLERSVVSHANGSESPTSTFVVSNPNTESGDVSERLEEPSRGKKVLLLDFVEEAIANEKLPDIAANSLQEQMCNSGNQSCNNSDSKGSSVNESPDEVSQPWQASWQMRNSEHPQLESLQCSSQSGTALYHQSSCTLSGKSTASSVGELPRTGYIINPVVAWDILLLLHESLLTASAEAYSQKAKQSNQERGTLSGQAMHGRVSRLSRHISEGLWRLQVLIPCHRKLGSLEIFDEYIEGKLFSGDTGSVLYDCLRKSSFKSYAGKAGCYTTSKKKHVEYESVEGRSCSSDNTSVINFLLAPPSCLLTMALTKGNLPEAEQVIKMYKIGDTPERREVYLVTRLRQLKPKLLTASQRANKVKGHRSSQIRENSQDTLLTLGLVAREASAQAAATSMVHELLSTSPPPVPTGIPTASSNSVCPLTSSFMNPHALVLSDLAITMDLSETTSSSLLEQALQRHRAHADSNVTMSDLSKTVSGVLGFIPIVQQLAMTCNSIISLRDPEAKVGYTCSTEDKSSVVCTKLGPPNMTPLNLLLSSYPVQEMHMKLYIQSWSKVLQNMVILQDLLLNPDTEEDTCESDSEVFGIGSRNNKVHLAYKEVLRLLSEETSNLFPNNLKTKESGKFGAYVRSFYQYLQLMSAMIARHANKNFQKSLTSYFSILSKRPVHILGSLMFQDGVDPSKLEHTAKQMKLNLTSMILQYCCPRITITSGSKSRMRLGMGVRDGVGHLGFQEIDGFIIMNAGSLLCQSCVNGELVVRDILTNLLSGLRESIQPISVSPHISHKAVLLNDSTSSVALQSQDIVMALKDTYDLAAVDFRKITPGDESVVFFVNLANLMFIHAGLLNHIVYPSDRKSLNPRGLFSSFQVERLMAMKRMGYLLGQLGFVSLYDVLYGIIKLQNPLSSIFIRSDPKSRFTLCESNLIGSHSSLKENNLQLISSLVSAIPPKVSFCVTQGSPISPCIQVLYSDRMGEQMEAAACEHLNLFLLMEERGPKVSQVVSSPEPSNGNRRNYSCCIATSRTLLNYLACHGSGAAGGIKTLEQDVPEEVASILKRLLRSGDTSQADIRVLDNSVSRGIALEFIESFETENSSIIRNNNDVFNASENSDNILQDSLREEGYESDEDFGAGEESSKPFGWLGVKVPIAVISHLKKQCPLLAFIVQALHSAMEMSKRVGQTWDDDSADTWLNLLYPPSIGVKPPAEETELFRACRNLFSTGKHRSLARIVEGNKVLSSLLQEPDFHFVWSFTDKMLGSSTVTKDSFRHLVSQVPLVIEVLQAAATFMLGNLSDLVLLIDHLLSFMVEEAPITEDNSTPWVYAHQISNADMRFAASHKSHSQWPVCAAVDVLRLLACDTRLESQQQKWANDRATQIQVYEEILNVSQPLADSWQEIERLSIQDPSGLLLMLIQKKHFKLGVKWAEHHRVDAGLKRLVDQSYLMDVLDRTSPDYGVAADALDTLCFEDLVIVTQALLTKLSSIPTRRFLLDFLLKMVIPSASMSVTCGNDGISNTKLNCLTLEKETSKISEPVVNESLDVDAFRQELMGLILVEEVAPVTDDRFQLSHLASSPHLIIEQWLMNIKLEAVEKAVKVLGRHMDLIGSRTAFDPSTKTINLKLLNWDAFNCLLESYAAKALDTTGVQFSLKPKQKGDKIPKKFVMPPQPPSRSDWVPDSDVGKCSVCTVAVFSMFCRRHHCRRCGRIVCASCSKSRMTVQGYGDLLVRVCQECFQQTKDINLEDFVQVRPLDDANFDSHSQSSEDVRSTRGSVSWASDIEGGWYLSTDSLHNSLVRQEFGYDYAPSLSLCLAILAQHQDDRRAAFCILKLCHHLFSLIVSAIISTSPEVDHNFVLSMIQTLLTSSKVRFGNVNEHQGIAVCEYYSQWVDLLSLLLRANCGDVIPQKALQNMLEIGEIHQKVLLKEENCTQKLEKCLKEEYIYMRHLRDSLVKKQFWELSLNVSTKAGLEVSGVWGAWAMASLRAGDFPGARERFSRVLERPADKNRPCKSSLLPEIIKYLESNPFHVDDKVMDHAERTRIMLSEQMRLLPSQALVVLHSLQNLKSMSEGNIKSKSSLASGIHGTKFKKQTAYKIDALFQNECKYYLRLYGDHSLTIQFLMRHKQLKECVEYLLADEIRDDLFVKEVLLPCMRTGKLDQLIKLFRNGDPQQTKWAKYLLAGCRWLEHSQWWNCLLMVQEGVGDRLRAVMTLLRMYTHDIGNYSGLLNRVHILTSAQQHLQTYLNTQILHGSFAKSKIILNMSGWQVNQYINILALQADATKFLAGCEMNGNPIGKLLFKLFDMKVLEDKTLPTLLGSENERLAVGALIVSGAQVIEESLGLAYRIIDMGVAAEKLLSVGCELLVYQEQYDSVGHLVKGMRECGMLSADNVDSALEPALLMMASNSTNANLDVLVKLFSTENAKIEAYIKCGRLKSAYLVAVHRGKYDDVIRVQQAAKDSGQAHVATMCTKWLTNHKSVVSNR